MHYVVIECLQLCDAIFPAIMHCQLHARKLTLIEISRVWFTQLTANGKSSPDFAAFISCNPYINLKEKCFCTYKYFHRSAHTAVDDGRQTCNRCRLRPFLTSLLVSVDSVFQLLLTEMLL